jgi:hypothetical protein
MFYDPIHEISALRDVCGCQGYRFRRQFVMGRIRAGFKIGRRHKAVINAFLDL